MNINGINPTLQNGRKTLYRTIWRWHFYAGLLCIPVIIILAVSGAVYLFKPQIDAWVDSDYRELTISGQRSSANQQIQAAMRALPAARFLSYQLPENERQAVIIQLQKDGKKIQVYVNPYTLDILKTIAYDDQFIRLVRSFHGELLAGNAGSIVVEMAACWAIVLIVTGLYLWWPRSAKGVAGILYPRLHKGGRIFWRDLHSVTGIWISALTLFLLVSGLPWALVWGSAFKELRQWNRDAIQQDWSLGRAQEARDNAKNATKQIKLDELVVIQAKSLNLASPVIMSPSRKNPAIWTVKSMHQNRPLRSNAWLDAKTGKVLKLQSFQQRELLDRIVGIAVAAHEGQLFGWFNQLLGVVTALGLMVVSISAFVLWRRRKPDHELGAPPIDANAKIGVGVVSITLFLALFLPLLAISIVTIVILEWALLRRCRASREWLGLQES